MDQLPSHLQALLKSACPVYDVPTEPTVDILSELEQAHRENNVAKIHQIKETVQNQLAKLTAMCHMDDGMNDGMNDSMHNIEAFMCEAFGTSTKVDSDIIKGLEQQCTNEDSPTASNQQHAGTSTG
jgi:hypothetical protein